MTDLLLTRVPETLVVVRGTTNMEVRIRPRRDQMRIIQANPVVGAPELNYIDGGNF